jgi:hypothetical protein
MINSITVTNYLGESLKLELRFPERSGFLVQEITGLGPPKADINATEVATGDGALFNSSRVTSRNIVLSLKLLENPTIEATRQLSYKYFPIKKRLKLLVETDKRTCETYGYVESNEPVIFSSLETTQISIICPDPYFYSTAKTITIFAGIEPVFEFPFSNESLTENLLGMGEITNKQQEVVYYEGDAEIGVVIYIHAIGEVRNLAIFNTVTHEELRINDQKLYALTGSTIKALDDIIISTVKGQKSIQLLREGIYTNILNCLDMNVNWFQLAKGDNFFVYTVDQGNSNLQFRIENQKVYEGV